jgi:hypothetical protein
MVSTNAQKCAHPVCSCMTTSGKYCSIACETMEGMPDIDCHCGHAVCKGETDHPATAESAHPS